MNISIFLENEVPFFRIQAHQVKRLRREFPNAEITGCRTEAAFLRILPKTHIALANRFRQVWFDQAPRLDVIFSPAAGRDVLAIQPPNNVEVRYGTFHGAFISETVLGLMLAFERGLFTSYRDQLNGDRWPRASLYPSHAIRLLNGSHAAIVGFGHIGEWISRLLKPFGVRISGFRRNPPSTRPTWFASDDAVVSISQLDRVLPTVDHLILALPSDTGTDHLIGARQLSRLPRHALLYNVGRGNCIDETALARALRSGRVRGACLDVYAQEPLPATSPLAENLPGLIRLPHSSAFSTRYIDAFLDGIIPDLKKKAGRS